MNRKIYSLVFVLFLSLCTNSPISATESQVTASTYRITGWECTTNGSPNPNAYFYVSYKPKYSTFWLDTQIFQGEYTLTNLLPQTSYDGEIRCSANRNDFGEPGIFSFSTLPKPVSNLTVDFRSQTALYVSWQDSSGSSNDQILNFVAEISANGGSTWTSTYLDESSTVVAFTGLTPDHEYQVRVKAVTTAGSSDYVTLTSVRTPPVPKKPDPVQSAELLPVDFKRWKLEWTIANSTSEEETQYLYTYKKHGTTKWSTPLNVLSKNFTTISDLKSGYKYEFKILSRNSLGASESQIFILSANEYIVPKAPGNICEKVGKTFQMKNGNVYICTKGAENSWILYSSRNWSKSRVKAFIKLLKQLKNEAKEVSLVVNQYWDGSAFAVSTLLFEKSLQILSEVDSVPSGISYSRYRATMIILADQADFAGWEWFNGYEQDGRARYREILFTLNDYFLKLNKVLGTKYKVPYL